MLIYFWQLFSKVTYTYIYMYYRNVFEYRNMIFFLYHPLLPIRHVVPDSCSIAELVAVL